MTSQIFYKTTKLEKFKLTKQIYSYKVLMFENIFTSFPNVFQMITDKCTI